MIAYGRALEHLENGCAVACVVVRRESDGERVVYLTAFPGSRKLRAASERAPFAVALGVCLKAREYAAREGFSA